MNVEIGAKKFIKKFISLDLIKKLEIIFNKMNTIAELPPQNDNEAPQSTQKISTFKIHASQCYATFATNLIKFTAGSFNGFTSVLIAELLKKDAEIEMSVEDISWFGSRYFMAPVGSLLFGIVSHNIGNRLTMLIAALLYTISCLTFYFALNATMLLSIQALIGLLSSVSIGAGNSYVVEIAQPQLRSTLTAFTSLSIITAGFFIVLLSNFLHWRILALVILVFPVIGFITILTVPESPHWLIGKGQFEKAKAALSWVRGWTTPSNVETEFNQIKEISENSSFEADRTSTEECKPNFKTLSHIKHVFRSYFQRSFYIPLASVCCIFMLQDISGFHALTTYFIVIFRKMDSPIDPHVAGSIFDGVRVLGALVFILFVRYTGKKKLVYFSLVVATLSYFIISTVLFLRERGIPSDTCSWIPIITMIIATFSTSAGIDKIVYILNVELFPTKYRNIGSGIGLFVFFTTHAVSNKLFIYAMDILTLPGIFLLFGIASVINFVMIYVILPETEGKTLEEIKDHYEGVKKLR